MGEREVKAWGQTECFVECGPWEITCHVNTTIAPNATVRGELVYQIVFTLSYDNGDHELDGIFGSLSTQPHYTLAEAHREALKLRGMTLAWFGEDEDGEEQLRTATAALADLVTRAIERYERLR